MRQKGGDSPPGDEIREARDRGQTTQRVLGDVGILFESTPQLPPIFPLLHPPTSITPETLPTRTAPPETTSQQPCSPSVFVPSSPPKILSPISPKHIHLSRRHYLRVKRGTNIHLHLFFLLCLDHVGGRRPCTLEVSRRPSTKL